MKGGKLLGKGTYGCVFDKAITCDETKNFSGVGKIFSSKNHSSEEYIEVMKVAKINSNGKFTNKLLNECSVNSRRLKKEEPEFTECPIITRVEQPFYHQLVYQQSGVDLKKYSEYSKFDLIILDGFLNVLEGIKELQKHSIVHRDIKPPNMLLTSTKKMLLIDFGIMTTYNDLYNMEKSEFALEYDYYIYPPEFKVFSYIHLLFKNKKTDIYSRLLMYVKMRASTWFNGYRYISNNQKFNEIDISLDSSELMNDLVTFVKTLNDELNFEKADMDSVYNEFTNVFSSKMDVFSIGMSMLDIYMNCNKDDIPKNIKTKFLKIIQNCIHFNPYLRSPIDTVISDLKKIIKSMNKRNVHNNNFVESLINISANKTCPKDTTPKSPISEYKTAKTFLNNSSSQMQNCLQKYSLHELKSFIKGKPEFKGMSQYNKSDLCKTISTFLDVRDSSFKTVKRGRRKK